MYRSKKGRVMLKTKKFLKWVLTVSIFAAFTFPSVVYTQINAVKSVGLTVSDMEQSVAFYRDILQFEKVFEKEVMGTKYEHLDGIFGLRKKMVTMRLGNEVIVLTEYLTPKGQFVPSDSRSNDHWFQHIAIIVSDMDKAYAWLRKHDVEHSSPAPQLLPDWNPDAGGISAFYFKDLDGHPLEILHFPPDKGSAKWQAQTDELFLGIDHTAIVVSDTAESLKFYRDILGFTLAAKSFNYGIEQERLNNVFGASLRISGLKVGRGPAIEFLEYLTPRDGRPIPLGAKPNDLFHWQTTLVTENISDLTDKLENANYKFISTGVVEFSEESIKALMVRDPDGHVMRIIEHYDN